MHHLNTTRNTT